MAFPQLLEALIQGLAPLWIEIAFILCFLAGFLVLKPELLVPGSKAKKFKADSTSAPPAAAGPFLKLKKAVEAEAASKEILAAWRLDCKSAPTPAPFLKPVLQAFADADTERLVPEVLEHLQQHHAALSNSRTGVAALDVIARTGKVEVMEELAHQLQEGLHISPTLQTYEVLLGGYAAAGDKAKVEEMMSHVRSSHPRLSAKALSLTIKGFLKNGMIDAVVEKISDMHRLGFQVPPFAITQLFRLACEASRAEELVDSLQDVMVWSPETFAVLFEACGKSQDLRFAKRLEHIMRQQDVTPSFVVYDALLKLYAVAGDANAHQLFQEMQKANVRISEGLCVGLIARCAESKFLRFAKEVMQFTRERGTTTLAVYSALMKVYAYCGMYGKACSLYDMILEDGLEPDTMMYGCLMKFAVECGRTDLSWRIAELAPQLDIQNYMSLIRAAGRDRDVDRAFAVLQRLKATGSTLDVAVYNCVLDVCVSSGHLDRARALMDEMRGRVAIDVITYNTLLKGFCQSGKLDKARAVLEDMAREGLKPNDVSFNCLIHAAVSSGPGGLRDAWATIDMMGRSGVPVDHYTLSILMKALKSTRNPKDIAKTLTLLDKSGVNVYSDEILFNSVLETCVRHDHRRLEGILEGFSGSGLRPAVHTYGSLIKACGALRRLPRCWELFKELEQRGMEPNDVVLGCMLDALVSNGEVDRAVELLAQWKQRVRPNTVIYSTIIKGFANSQQAGRALDMWHEMRREGVKANTVVYNAVIDAQARCGSMEVLSDLVKHMQADGVALDAITYSTIVKGYCVKGDLAQAVEVFRDMQKGGMVKESVVYNTLLDGCTRHAQFALADSLLEEMLSSNVLPTNFTLGILVKMYGRRRQLDKAFEVVEMLSKRFNLTLNGQVRMSLLCVCVNNNAPQKAREVFEQMKLMPNGLDAKAYNTLIACYTRNGLLEDAIGLVEEAYGLAGARSLPHGQSLDVESVEKLLQALSQKGLSKLGVPLLERLKAAKVPLTGRLCVSAMGAGARAPGKWRA